MYCLRVLLLYMYIVCYSVYCDYFGVLIDCCVRELHAKLCSHRNVWPEIVVLSFIALHLLVLRELNVLPEAVYCLKELH